MRTSNKLLVALLLPVLTVVSGCIDDSSTNAAFDQVLETTTIFNKLLAPVVIYRNGAFLDTLRPQTSKTYSLNQKGFFRHTWKLVAPLDANNQKAGVEPTGDLDVQYEINAKYEINNRSADKTIFTPFITNSTTFDVRLTANDRATDQFITNLIVPRRASITAVPYYYWNDNSNIRLDAVGGSAYFIYARNGKDTNATRDLELDSSATLNGTGSTFPLIVP